MQTMTICGSMKFEKEMQEIAFALETKHGYNVLQCIGGLQKDLLSPENIHTLEKAHLKKIEISDAIFVVDIDGYIGDMTKKEIEFAKRHDKAVLYYSEYPL